MANVETLEVKAFGNIFWNMVNVTGLQKVVNNGSVAQVTLNNLSGIVEIEDKNTTAGAGLVVDYLAGAVSSLSDEQKITLDGAGSSANRETITLEGGNIEKVSITATGSSSRVDLKTEGTNELVITGEADLNLTVTDNDGGNNGNINGTVGNNIQTINAADATGNLNLDIANYSATTQAMGGVNQIITLGSGDDRLTVDNFNDQDTVDTGDGNDRVTIVAQAANEHTASKALTIKNAETVGFVVDADGNVANESYIYNLQGVDSIQTLAIGAPAGGGDSVTLNKVASTLTTIAYNGGGATADRTFDTYTVNLADTTGNQTLDITVTNKDQNGNLINNTKGTQLIASLTANGIETINIKTDQLHPNSDNLTPENYDGGFKLTLNADGLHTITVESPTFVDLSGGALDDQVKTVDATKADGGVKLNLNGVVDADTATNQKVTVTTGKGDDTIQSLSPGNAADYSVSTGEGNDSIILGGNVNGKKLTINAGEGNDTIDVTNENNVNAGSQISITTGSGADTIEISGGAADTVEITDFTAGGGGDKIDLANNNATDASASSTLVNSKSIDTSDSSENFSGVGLVIATNTISAGANNAFEADEIISGASSTTFNDNTNKDVVYVVFSDGADAYLVMITDDDTTNGPSSGDTVDILVKFSGIADASTFTADNFADFL